MWGKVNFSTCPMYAKSHANGTKLTKLEDEVSAIHVTINEINTEQRLTMESHITMKEDIKSMKDSLTSHMTEEAVHHKNTADAITGLTENVHTLLNGSEAHRKEREKREELAEKQQESWRSLWFRVGGSIFLVVILALGGFMWKSLTYYSTATATHAIQKEILHNEKKVLYYDERRRR